jgi:protein tyrosine/serine phosphatase
MHVRIAPACFTLALLTGSGPFVVSAAAEARRDAPVARFEQVGPRLYRGGQPDDSGFAFLRDLGIRTVISLRNDDTERRLVESLGMAFEHIPITFHPLGLGNDFPDAAVERFFALVDNPASGKVFVHCKRGADRTGALVGLYRVTRQDWTLDRAFDEARDVGMRWWHFPVKGKMAALVQTFSRRSIGSVR